MPQAIEHEWAYSRDPNCILVLFLEGRTVNVAAASGSGPDPALHRFTSIFPSGLQYGPDSWRHRKHSAGCRCLSVGNEYGAISAVCPSDLLPTHSMTFVGPHPRLGQDGSYRCQRFTCRCQIAGLFIQADNVLAMAFSR